MKSLINIVEKLIDTTSQDVQVALQAEVERIMTQELGLKNFTIDVIDHKFVINTFDTFVGKSNHDSTLDGKDYSIQKIVSKNDKLPTTYVTDLSNIEIEYAGKKSIVFETTSLEDITCRSKTDITINALREFDCSFYAENQITIREHVTILKHCIFDAPIVHITFRDNTHWTKNFVACETLQIDFSRGAYSSSKLYKLLYTQQHNEITIKDVLNSLEKDYQIKPMNHIDRITIKIDDVKFALQIQTSTYSVNKIQY